MFGGMESFRPLNKPKASPEEIQAALRAADMVAREKAASQKKIEAEHAETGRLTRLMHEEQARTAKPYEITEEDVEEAEKATGQKFERLN